MEQAGFATPLCESRRREEYFYLVVDVPVLPEVMLPPLVVVFFFDFLSGLPDAPGVLVVPGDMVRGELVSGATVCPGTVEVPLRGVVDVPGVVVEPGLVVVPGAVVVGAVDVPAPAAPPACANKTEPPRKTPIAGTSNSESFLRIMVSF